MTSWDVVLWKEEKKVDCIPSSWRVNGRKDLYMWPNIPVNKIKRLIKDCMAPDINIQYQEFPAICKATVDNLDVAESYVEKLQYQTDLSSSEKPSSDESEQDTENETLKNSVLSNNDGKKPFLFYFEKKF